MRSRKSPTVAAVDDIRADLQTLRDDIATLADQVGGTVSQSGNMALSGVKTQLRRIKDNLDSTLSDATEKGRVAGAAAQNMTGHLAETLEDSMRVRPLTTLLLAVGVGFVFGAAMRR